MDEIKILNPGDTPYKLGDMMRRQEIDKANAELARPQTG